MLRQFRAELSKLATVRSTYIIAAICVAITAFVSFYIFGYRGTISPQEPKMISGIMVIVLTNLIFFIGLIGVLLVTHEYRYNTIMYTLTAAKSRMSVLLAKIAVVTVASVALTLIIVLLAALLTYAGVAIKGGLSISPQDYTVWDLFWRLTFFGWAYAMLALIFAFIIRSQIGTIAALFFLPSAAEGLLQLLIKEKAMYLPFSALNSVLQPTQMSHGKAALVVSLYIVVGLVIAAILFKKRDAN